jgi:hypothetical protein
MSTSSSSSVYSQASADPVPAPSELATCAEIEILVHMLILNPDHLTIYNMNSQLARPVLAANYYHVFIRAAEGLQSGYKLYALLSELPKPLLEIVSGPLTETELDRSTRMGVFERRDKVWELHQQLRTMKGVVIDEEKEKQLAKLLGKLTE